MDESGVTLKPQPWGVKRCARCGQDHPDMAFKKFVGSPIVDEDGTVWNYWATCPVTGDPVLGHLVPPDKAEQAGES